MKKGIFVASFLLMFIAAAIYLYPAAGKPPAIITSVIPPISSNTHTDSPKPNAGSSSVSSSLGSSEFEQAFDQWLAYIQTSTRPADQIARVIYQKDAEKNIAYLKVLLEADPQNPLLHYLLAQNCARKFISSVCKPVRESALAIFAADNGVVADLEFVEVSQQAKLSAAMTILNEANHASYTNNFDGEKFKALAESLELAGIKHDLSMVIAIEGILAAGVDTTYSNLLKTCKQQTYRAWQDACYTRGEALAERSTSRYLKEVGLSMMGNTDRNKEPLYATLQLQMHTQLENLNNAVPLWDSARATGFQFNNAQWEEFLLLYQTQGDIAAKTYILNLIKQ